MAVVNPSYQEFFDLTDGSSIGVTRFKLVESSVQVLLPPPLYDPLGGTGAQVLDTADVALTSSFYISDSGLVNLGSTAASANKEVTFISIHPQGNGNFRVTVG